MVISGKVSCKVPFYKQLIFLSNDEKALYMEEFADDILQVSEASEINKQFGLDISENKTNEKIKRVEQHMDQQIDISKLVHLKNVY